MVDRDGLAPPTHWSSTNRSTWLSYRSIKKAHLIAEYQTGFFCIRKALSKAFQYLKNLLCHLFIIFIGHNCPWAYTKRSCIRLQTYKIVNIINYHYFSNKKPRRPRGSSGFIWAWLFHQATVFSSPDRVCYITRFIFLGTKRSVSVT